MSDYPPPQQPGWGQPGPPQQPGGAPPPGQGYPPSGPSPQQPGWSQPPQQPGWGQPPQQPGWGQPPQQPGWGAPGQAGYAPPPKKKRRWPLILGIVLGVLVLMFGGCALLIRKGVEAVTAPIDASNAWLAAADAEDLGELENLTCDADQTVIDSGISALIEAGFDGSKNLNGSNIVNSDATVTGTVGTDTGDQSVTFSLSKAGSGEGKSGWCVDGVTVGF